QLPALETNDRHIAISADGTRVVYRTGADGGLAVRPIGQLNATTLPGITGARNPFLSPDGQWIGFFTSDALQKVSIAGGAPITLCHVNGLPRGASWGDDGTIVFATVDPATGLMSVPSGGGEPKTLTKPDPGERDHILPFVLPGGKAVLFSTAVSAGSINTATSLESGIIAAFNLKSGERKILIRGGTNAEYVATGHLVY